MGKNRHRRLALIFLPLAAALALAGSASLGPVDLAWYDTLSRCVAAVRDPGRDERGRPVIVAIDAAALRRYGRWPWPRERLGLLLAKIAAGRPRAVGIDILLNDPAPGEEGLAEILGRVRVVLAARLGLRRIGEGTIAAGEIDLPRPLYSRAAYDSGFIDFFPDPDGVARRMLTRLAGGPIRLSFAAALARAAGELPADLPEEVFLFPRYLVEKEVVGAAQILAGELPSSYFRDRVVFVGLIAPGAAGDVFPTPLRHLGRLSGVELHACAYATIVRRAYIRRMPAAPAWAVFLLLPLAWVGLTQAASPWRMAALYLFFVFAAFFASASLFALRWWWSPFAALVALSATVVSHLIAHAAETHRRERRLRAAFARFVSPEVLRQILAGPEPALGGEAREVTVLFADLRGFTRYAEEEPPEVVVARLNEHLGLMSHAVHAHGGMVDKFLGDAVMAVFGAPLPDPEHRRHALAAAEAIRAALDGPGFLPVGIGLASGMVVVGNIGSPERLEYTAVGDPVNLAARLQEMAGPGEILAAESCFPEGPPADWVSLGRLPVRGKSGGVVVYRHP